MKKALSKDNGGRSITAEEAADLYGFLASVLNNRHDEKIVENLRTYFLNNSDELTQEMEEYWKQQSDMSIADISTELSVDWTRLFRGISPSYGPPPPYTGVYQSADGTGIKFLLSVQNAYKEGGLEPDIKKKRDRFDYLGFELEFMSHLANQMVLAQESNDTEKAKEYGKKLNKFADSFVRPWISSFVDKALPHAKTSFFQGYLKLLNNAGVRVE